MPLLIWQEVGLVETPAAGSGRKYRRSSINSPTLTSCVAGGGVPTCFKGPT